MFDTVKLYEHQKEGLEFAISRNGTCALLWSCGTGKSLCAIKIFQHFRAANPSLKLLVVCPLTLLTFTWPDELKKFSDFTHTSLRAKKFNEKADVYLINFESVITKRCLPIVNDLLTRHPMMCLVDESSKLKQFNTKITKTMLSLSSKFKHRIIATGTAAPNNELNLYGQMEFIKPGIFGSSFHKMKNTYAHLSNGRKIIPNKFMDKTALQGLFKKGFQYVVSEKNREKILTVVKPHCNYVKKEDCLDLPPKTFQYRYFDLGKEERKAYDQMRRDLITEIKGEQITGPIALTKLTKMRQIVAGFAYTEEGSPMHLPTPTRVKVLLETLSELENEQIMIWVNYREEAYMIERALKEYSVIGIEELRERRGDALNDFKEKKKQILIANGLMIGHGVTLTECSVQIFYSLNFSAELFEQCMSRIHRINMGNKALYIILMAKDTIDNQMLSVLQKKIDTQNAIADFLKG